MTPFYLQVSIQGTGAGWLHFTNDPDYDKENSEDFWYICRSVEEACKSAIAQIEEEFKRWKETYYEHDTLI